MTEVVRIGLLAAARLARVMEMVAERFSTARDGWRW